MTGDKVDWVGNPRITAFWLNTYPHERHLLQKSRYTIATRPKDGDHQFASHGQVFNAGEANQDILIKYIIPETERLKALAFLDEKGINHFSLMKSVEARMKTFAFRQIELRNL